MDVLNVISSELSQVFYIIITIIGAIAGSFTIYEYLRPKINHQKIVSNFVDFSKDEMVQEREMEISWPRSCFFKTIQLPKLPREARYDIAYKSTISPKQALQRKYYSVIEKDKYTKIKLVNKKFFEESEIKLIYVTHYLLHDSDYRKKIECHQTNDSIIVQNTNLFEVYNYKITLNNPITVDKAKPYLNYIEEFKTNKEQSGEALITELILKPLPECKNGKPGRIEISVK